MKPSRLAGRKFQRLIEIIGTLRGPKGCPWDRKQDVRSLTDYFLEEAFEAAEACLSGDPDAVSEELGDILMEVVFLARLFEEKGLFSLSDSLDKINAKMFERHPHVFGDEKMGEAAEVVDLWQKRKLREKGRGSVLDGLGEDRPSLLASLQIGQRVASCGFDWPGPREALEKLREEIGELEDAIARGNTSEVEEEIGDMFFALSNVSRLLRINPEMALRRANRKFAARFRELENRLRKEGRRLEETTLQEMDEIWNLIKKEN